MLKKSLPYALEFNTKLISFATSLILASSLSIADFGEYTYLRSFLLVAGTLLLLGLQTSSFKFLNEAYPQRIGYLKFTLMIITLLGTLAFIIIFWGKEQLFAKFESELGFYMQFLVGITMLTLFFSAFFKAIGRATIGFTFNFIVALVFLLTVSYFYNLGDLSLNKVFDSYLFINMMAALLTVSFLVLFLQKHQSTTNHFKTAEWLGISTNMWLSGFLPMLLLQGLVLVFGAFFSTENLGFLGIAVLIAANLAMFKEVSIAVYLPKLITAYQRNSIINGKLLFKMTFIGSFPVVLFLAVLLSLEPLLKAWFPEKLQPLVFTFTYTLIIGQIFMSIYQPIFRLLAAVGYHKSILNISLSLAVILLISYIHFGLSENTKLFVLSSTIVSAIALVIATFILSFRNRGSLKW